MLSTLMDMKTEFFKLFWSELGTHAFRWWVPYVIIFIKLINQMLDRALIWHSYIGKCISKLILCTFIRLRCKVMFQDKNTVWALKNHSNNVYLPLVWHETVLNAVLPDENFENPHFFKKKNNPHTSNMGIKCKIFSSRTPKWSLFSPLVILYFIFTRKTIIK